MNRELQKIAAQLGTTAYDLEQLAAGKRQQGGITQKILNWLGSLWNGGAKNKTQPRTPDEPKRTTPPPPSSPREPDGTAQKPPGRRAPGLGKFGQEVIRGSKPVFTPASSNVYSYNYNAVDRILYVTFKAQNFHAGSISSGQVKLAGRTSQKQAIGTRGKTIQGGRRPNSPGVTYAYFNVPPDVFSRFSRSASASAGKAVWDILRVRGTIFGHRYQYQVVSGQSLPGMAGQSYIPRKATANGFRTRSLRVIGSREFQTSTIPAGSGSFRTRSAS